MTRGEPMPGDVSVNGARLRYLDWGGAGDPIVMLHATGLLGRLWRPIAETLTAAGHVFTYDQRGHGDSDAPLPVEQYNWAMTMNDLAGFITAMNWRGVRAVGHSAGATAIASIASEQPELISRAVLVEPVVFEAVAGPLWGNPLYERTLKRRREFDSVEAMVANFDRRPPYDAWQKDLLREYCEFGTRPTADRKRTLKCAPEIEAHIYHTARDFDGLGRLLRAGQPMLVIFGERGNLFGSDLDQKIERQLKHGRVINISGGGHFLPMEQPERVAQLALEFLR